MSIKGTQYNIHELRRYGGKTILLFTGTIVASGNNRTNTSYPLLNVMQFKECSFFLDCPTLDGTPGTFDVYIDTKSPAGDAYSELVHFTQLTAIGNEMKYIQYCLGEILGVRWVLVTFTRAIFSVYGVFKIM